MKILFIFVIVYWSANINNSARPAKPIEQEKRIIKVAPDTNQGHDQ